MKKTSEGDSKGTGMSDAPAEKPVSKSILEKRLDAANSQVMLLTAERNELKKDNKRLAMKHGIFRALSDEMQFMITPLDPLPDARKPFASGKVVEETLVIHLSDMHADEEVEPHMVGGLEKYGIEIACCRAERMVDTILKFTQETLANYHFKKVVILSYGDSTSGEIHGGVNHSSYRNMFRNSLAIGQLQALMIRDIAPHFAEVEVLCLPGNHGRRSPKKDYNGPWDNWDYLISEIARLHCADLKNVKFHIPECFSVVTEIAGHQFYIAHGDDIKSWNSIPFYGIERKTRRLVALHNAMTDKKVKYFVFGHFHMLSSMSDLNGETIINGAWCGTSAYSYESFSGYREPQQLIHGVHPDYGITWRLFVKLKDVEREAKGSQRYKIILTDKEFTQ